METKISMGKIIDEYKKRKTEHNEAHKIYEEEKASTQLILQIPEAFMYNTQDDDAFLLRGSTVNNIYSKIKLPDNLAILSIPILICINGCENCGKAQQYLDSLIYFEKEDKFINVEEKKEEIKNV
jgi:hypothetical protein